MWLIWGVHGWLQLPGCPSFHGAHGTPPCNQQGLGISMAERPELRGFPGFFLESFGMAKEDGIQIQSNPIQSDPIPSMSFRQVTEVSNKILWSAPT